MLKSTTNPLFSEEDAQNADEQLLAAFPAHTHWLFTCMTSNLELRVTCIFENRSMNKFYLEEEEKTGCFAIIVLYMDCIVNIMWLFLTEGAQLLRGRVIGSRPKGAGSSLTGVTALCPCMTSTWELQVTDIFENRSMNKHDLEEEEKVDCVTIIVLQMYCYYKYSVALPHGAVDWSAVCDCGIS